MPGSDRRSGPNAGDRPTRGSDLDPAPIRHYARRPMTTADHPDLPEPTLPPRPERPDCCAGGCATCVLDGYFEEVQQWERQVEEIKARHLAARPVDP